MTTFDRIEPRLPELIDELATASVPDYFDDLLRATAGAKQRPAWSSPERWLPIAVTVQAREVGALPWRPIVAVILLAFLLVAGALILSGSQPRLPEPFGPARNGFIVYSTANGEIMAIDPRNGAVRPLVTGREIDSNPRFANDGTKFAFERQEGAARQALYVASADGSGIRKTMDPAAAIKIFDWSPDGSRFLVSRIDDPYGAVTVVDVDDGSSTTFDVGMHVFGGIWRPNADQLIVTAQAPGQRGSERGIYRVGSDGDGLTPIVVGPDIVELARVSPDGSLLTFTTWAPGAEGRTHVLDIDSGVELPIARAGDAESTDAWSAFLPDGTNLLIMRRTDDVGYRPTVVPIDGGAPAVPLGAGYPDQHGWRVMWSPDSTEVHVAHGDDGGTWQYDVMSGAGEPLAWSIPIERLATWQRLAP